MSYWDQVLSKRTAGGVAAPGVGAGTTAAALLAACGGDDDDGGGSIGGTGGSSGLVAKPEDTTAKAKAGVWKHFSRGDATHFDSLISDTSQVVSISGYLGYSKLLGWKQASTRTSSTGPRKASTPRHGR